MRTLFVHLLGRFSVQVEKKPVLALDTGKVKELFSYLLLHRKAPHHRETLADLLWHQATTSQSKRYLSKALWQLQSSLDICEEVGTSVLTIEPDWIQINPSCPLWLDVSVLEQAFESVKHVAGGQLNQEQVNQLCRAIDLYHSELLAGWYQDWCIVERERLQFIFLSLMDKLMMYYESQQAYDQAIVCGQQILCYDRARERTHRRLMRSYYLSGDRTGALRQYERCCTVLEDELQVQPDHRTQFLFEQIQNDALPNWELNSTAYHLQLCLLQQRLTVIQAQLQQEIDFLDHLGKSARHGAQNFQ